jgi:hypothetical protein
MKSIKYLTFLAIFLLFPYSNATATSITTSGSGTLFGDSYGYLFTIDDQGTTGATSYFATLTNTSAGSLNGALIDLLAFNMNAELGNDFTIVSSSPLWIYGPPTNNAVNFDYIGERTSPTTRLAPGNSLTFTFLFDANFIFPSDPFSIWTGTGASLGTSIGGGDISGQVAVSFQQLGSDGEGSALIASNWGSQPTPVPEPTTMLLLSAGLTGLAFSGRKRFLK